MRFSLLTQLFETRRKQLPAITPYVEAEPKFDEVALAALCPHIRAILDVELTEGNVIEVCKFSNWPRENSIVLTVNRLFIHTYPDHYPVSEPVFYSMFDPKVGDGDTYYCDEHSHLIVAPMPTLKSLGWGK
ncbi:hypothetical protein IAD21_00086 [Abditibacteriota bacterium]|nr:hypothetical protein IAD21_00086 [Abditibacteriota bacterium]